MKIKVCGLADANNMQAVALCQPDYTGFIFYPGSKRYAGHRPDLQDMITALKNVTKVGVFVNASVQDILAAIKQYGLHLIQLHGEESPDICMEMTATRPVIKAFQIDAQFDFEKLRPYESVCRYFLFDAASAQYGGSGKTFDWTLLEQYTLSTPFFLSGGISPEHIPVIKNIDHPALYGVDVNSGFELTPGVKNIKQIKKLINAIRY